MVLKIKLGVFFVLLSAPGVLLAQTYASEARTKAAVGHYARSRALLIQALEEFEQGRKLARPDLLIDPQEWRLSVISRTEELNRVLDPNPKITASGVRFKAADSLLSDIPKPSTRTQRAKSASYFGEDQRKRELEAARRRSLSRGGVSRQERRVDPSVAKKSASFIPKKQGQNSSSKPPMYKQQAEQEIRQTEQIELNSEIEPVNVGGKIDYSQKVEPEVVDAEPKQVQQEESKDAKALVTDDEKKKQELLKVLDERVEEIEEEVEDAAQEAEEVKDKTEPTLDKELDDLFNSY